MNVRILCPSARVVSGIFLDDSLKIEAKARAVTVMYGQLLVTRVQAKASGRPGPNAPTGDYRRSINLRVQHEVYGTLAYVGTNAPQGRRLEFGFVGEDSLKRKYNQPPYPHFGPAVDEIAPQFAAALEAIL